MPCFFDEIFIALAMKLSSKQTATNANGEQQQQSLTSKPVKEQGKSRTNCKAQCKKANCRSRR